MEYTKADLHRIGTQWLERIEESERRERNWYSEAERAEAHYSADEEGSDDALPDFNIVHSNVETIVPAIINSAPSPNIRPGHGQNDKPAKNVADIFEKTIEAQTDDDRLEEEAEGVAQDAFLAGRGVIRVLFDADEIPAVVAEHPDTGISFEISPAEVINERLLYQVVSWRDYREGPAKRWRDVPWVAFRHEVGEDERQRLEDPELMALQRSETDPENEELEATIWEIWCRETGKVYMVSDVSAKVLAIKPDPLGLKRFFPCAKPMQPITVTKHRVPVCPYAIYRKLALELDTATKRINKIMKGLKVRGAIAADADVVEFLAEADDNDIVAVPNIENIAAAGGLSKAIAWWPIDMAIAVLRELYMEREQTRQAIYEITGISDIVRGQSSAAETATAQQIKTEWGSLRVKKMQKQIQRVIRDVYVISAEIISRHFSYETLMKTTGIQIGPAEAAMLEKPLDHYRIDVETDSTIRADLTKSRREMSEFLTGTANFFQTMAPVVAQAPATAGAIAKMYAAFARQFSLGKAGEDALEEFIAMAEAAGQQAGARQNDGDDALKKAELQHKVQMDERDAERKDAEFIVETARKVAQAGLDRDKMDLDEGKAIIDAAALLVEKNLEQTQERPVALGV